MDFSLHAFGDIATADWLNLLNHPDVIRHMPLTDGLWTADAVVGWTKSKDAQWAEHGYGPWAIRIDGAFAGWGGFQKEGDEADLALVLLAQYWGCGARIFRGLMARRSALGIDVVSIMLPLSRSRIRGLARLGFSFVQELDYAGQRFMKFSTAP